MERNERLNMAGYLLDHLAIDEAIELMEEPVLEEPDNPQHLIDLGMTLISARRARRAIEIFSLTIAAQPHNPDLHGYLAQSKYYCQDYSGARSSIKSALAIDNTNLIALNTLGMVEIEEGNYQAAEQTFTTIIDQHGPYPSILVERAFARARIEKYNDAIADCTTALSQTPNHVAALQSRASLYEMVGQQSLAEQDRSTLRSFGNAQSLLDIITAKETK